MRRIFISNELENQVDVFYSGLQLLNKDGKTPIECLKIFKKSLSVFCTNKKAYIDHIILNYHRILRAKPSEIKILIQEFNFFKLGNLDTNFHEKIVEAMMYKELRQAILPLLQKINIKACVYCNTQSTVIIDIKYKRKYLGFKKGDVRKRSGRLELDHFYAKSKYPFLSTSFYNLFPCCGSCNKSKSMNDAKFDLYSENAKDLEVFRFKFIDSSKDKYWETNDINDLQFEFVHVKGDIDFLKDHNKHFVIPELYETQKDIIEELVHIKEAYNEASKESLVNSFSNLFPDKSLINRLLIGNYDKPEDVHKRPLAKFTQDIARELKLI